MLVPRLQLGVSMSPRKFRREVKPPTSRRLVWISLGLLAAFLVASIAVMGPVVMNESGDSKVDIARHTIDAFRSMHAIDPWGQPYQIVRFDRTDVIVYSIGEDGVAGTADDIWSNR